MVRTPGRGAPQAPRPRLKPGLKLWGVSCFWLFFGLAGQLILSHNALAAFECGNNRLAAEDIIDEGKWMRTCDSTNYSNPQVTNGVPRDVRQNDGSITYFPGRSTPPAFGYDQGLSVQLDDFIGPGSMAPDGTSRYDDMFGTGPDATRTAQIRLPLRFIKKTCTVGGGMCFERVGTKIGDPKDGDGVPEPLYWLLLDRKGRRPIDVNDVNMARFTRAGIGLGIANPPELREDQYGELFIEAQTEALAHGVDEAELVIDGIDVRPIPPTVDMDGNARRPRNDDFIGARFGSHGVNVLPGLPLFPWMGEYSITVQGGATIEGGSVVGDRIFADNGINLTNVGLPNSGDLEVNVIDGIVRSYGTGISVASQNEEGMAIVKLQDRALIERLKDPAEGAPLGSTVTPGMITTSGDNSSGIAAITNRAGGSVRVNTPLAIRTTGDESVGVAFLTNWPGEDLLLVETQRRAREEGVTSDGIFLLKVLELALGPVPATVEGYAALTRQSILDALDPDDPSPAVEQFITPATEQAIRLAFEAISDPDLITDDYIDEVRQNVIRRIERTAAIAGGPPLHLRRGIQLQSRGDRPTDGVRLYINDRPANQESDADTDNTDDRPGIHVEDVWANAIDASIASESLEILGTIVIGSEGDFDEDEALTDEVDFDGDGVADAMVHRSRLVVDEPIETTGEASHGAWGRISDGRAFDARVEADISTIGNEADAILLRAESRNEFSDTSPVTIDVAEGAAVTAAGEDASGVHVIGDGEKTVRIDGTVMGGSGSGAGVHIEGDGNVIVGSTGEVGAASGVAILGEESRLSILLRVPDLEDLEVAVGEVDRRVRGSILNTGGLTDFRLEDGAGRTFTLLSNNRAAGILPVDGRGGLYGRGFTLQDGVLQMTEDFAPRASVYEALPQVLSGLNQAPSLRERIGGRRWDGSLWVRMGGKTGRHKPESSTTGGRYDWDSWQFEAGVAGSPGRKTGGSSRWSVEASVHYGTTTADVSGRPVFGVDKGSVKTTDYGVVVNATRIAGNGFYLDGSIAVSRYDVDLASTLSGTLQDGLTGWGTSFGVEAGWRPRPGRMALTPHVQLVWSRVDLDSFADPSGASVSVDDGDTLLGRVGFALEGGAASGNDGIHLRSSAFLEQEVGNGTAMEISGERLAMDAAPTRAVVLAGGSWRGQGGAATVFGQLNASSTFDGSHDIGGSVGLKFQF